jgi:4-hydroxy-3-polyprenylbenzoate decarboxylase
MSHPICVGITGASGAVYAIRLLDVLIANGLDVHLSISPSGREVLEQELGLKIAPNQCDASDLLSNPTDSSGKRGRLRYCTCHDFMSPMASGSFLTGGMVICPCSGTTLSAIAAGASGNLIQRAAEVHLKERRRLVLVPRETPLSLAHIDNMRRVTEAGAVVLPASPGWYHGANSLDDLVDFIVARICDQLEIENTFVTRWGSP